MNFKTFGFTTAVATAVAAGAMMSSAPAQALQLSGSLGLGGPSTFYFKEATGSATQANFSALNETLYLGFGNPTGSEGIGSFSFLGTADTPTPGGVTLNRLPLTLTSQDTTTGARTFTASLPVSPFINFGNRTINGENRPLSFILDSGIFTGSVFPASALLPAPAAAIQSVVGSNIAGRFVFGEETIGRGFLSASISGRTGRYEMTLLAEPIPTPALLPGLAALGLSAIRKRKQVEEPEAVKA